MQETAIQKILSEAFNESFASGFPPVITPRNSAIPAFRMIYLPGGIFTMGDDKSEYKYEKPEHKVKVSSFYMAEFQVTQELYFYVTEKNPSRFRNLKKPVEQVSWYDSLEFCNALNQKLGLQPVYLKKNKDEYEWDRARCGIRLPAEAEWEYAARGGVLNDKAGNKNKDYTYSGSDKLHRVGWYNENSHGQSQKTGLKFPNANGLYDMSGNVWEWCWDRFDNAYYQQCRDKGIVENPIGSPEGSVRVLRGGSWLNYADYCRLAYRINYDPGHRWRNRGFRLVFAFQFTNLSQEGKILNE